MILMCGNSIPVWTEGPQSGSEWRGGYKFVLFLLTSSTRLNRKVQGRGGYHPVQWPQDGPEWRGSAGRDRVERRRRGGERRREAARGGKSAKSEAARGGERRREAARGGERRREAARGGERRREAARGSERRREAARGGGLKSRRLSPPLTGRLSPRRISRRSLG
jgi:hypothetical protein